MGLGVVEMGFLMFVASFFALLFIWPLWMVLQKTGYPGAFSLFALIPLGAVVLLFVLGFSEWPIEREVKSLRGEATPQTVPTVG